MSLKKKSIVRLIFLAFITYVSCKHAAHGDRSVPVHALITAHVKLRPAMQPQDVYKLLYQGTMGIGHLITDTCKAKKYLLDEFSSLDTTVNLINDSLMEPVSYDSALLRVNLRPFRSRKMNPDGLFAAMLGTVKNYSPDKELFLHDWKIFIHLTGSDQFPFEKDSVTVFDEMMRSMNYPVIHHSERYLKIYRPAYRVVLRSEWEKYFKY